MEATRFAAEVSRLQAELAPTPPWSWVARGLAAALTGFESGGLTDPILLCDLQRQWQGGKAARQAAAKDDVVRALVVVPARARRGARKEKARRAGVSASSPRERA